MKRQILIFLYIFLGLFIGLFFSEPVISTDPVFKRMLRNQLLDYFQGMYSCHARAQLNHINLVQGTLILTDICVQPRDNHDWSWQSNQCTIRLLPFAWFFTKSIPVQLEFDDFIIHTCYKNNSCTIIPHFQQLFKVPDKPTPFFIHQLSLSKLYGQIHNEAHHTIAHFQATFEMLWQNNTIENRIIITDATITIPHCMPCSLEGPVYLSIFNPLGKNIIQLFFDQKLSCTHNNQAYFLHIKGNWDSTTGFISVEKDGVELAHINLQADGSFTIDSGSQLHQLLQLPMAYRFKGHVQGNIHQPTKGTAYNTLCTYQPYITHSTGIYRFSYPFLYGIITTQFKDITIKAVFCCNMVQQEAFIYISNVTDISLNAVICPANSFKALMRINRQEYRINGSYNSFVLHLQGSLNPTITLPRGFLKQNGTQLMTIWPNQTTNALNGSFDCSYFAHPQLQTSGFFDFVMQYHYPHITINGYCKSPWIMPALGNSIACNNAELILDIAQQTIVIPHITFDLHKGQAHLIQGIITNDTMHIPLVVEQCFVRPDPDLYALISANLLFKKDISSILQGTITLEQCHYAKNILAAELTKQLTTSSLDMPELGNNIMLDLNVITQQPINVKTAFLTGQAHAHLKLSQAITNPVIEGTLDIVQGTLHFPYKPLHITQGSLLFLPFQPHDPLINVTAKNRIKKHQVTLRAHGTITNPTIHLESSPSLSNEQIIALLLTGSQERSLAITIPTLVMQQIQQLMFGPALADSTLAQYFKKFTKPFKNIRFIPHLTDQSARGGIRAGLEINYDDNLRAYIQKNLTLTEDTFFEVEYQCTDHVGIRGIKDEHGDLGAEVEMRWKF